MNISKLYKSMLIMVVLFFNITIAKGDDLISKAKHGDPEAMAIVGARYMAGSNGLKQNLSTAVMWFKKASALNNKNAQFLLGVCFETGMGTTKNLTEAANLYRKSAEQGYVVSQARLGCCYLFGNGVFKDPIEAHAWLSIAVEGNIKDGRIGDILENLEKNLAEEELQKALDRKNKIKVEINDKSKL